MKKTIIIVLVVVVVGILGFVACNFLTPSVKVPQAFVDKHNERAVLEREATQAADLNNSPEWSAFDQQMDEKNYTEAVVSLEGALGRKKEAATKLTAIEGKLSELKTIAGEIEDSEIKAKAENFIEVAKTENSAKIVYNNFQIEMIEKIKAMVSILAENPETISVADEERIDELSGEIDDLEIKIDEAESNLNEIQDQYKVTEKEFFDLVGLEAEE